MEPMLYNATNSNSRRDEITRGPCGILACRGAIVKDALKSDVVLGYKTFGPSAGQYCRNAGTDPKRCIDAPDCFILGHSRWN